jgi:hypothetical protein
MSHDPMLARIIPVLAEIPGVAAIVLGGSRTIESLTVRVADVWQSIGASRYAAALQVLRSLEHDLREASAK